jgi:hypothetical protein
MGNGMIRLVESSALLSVSSEPLEVKKKKKKKQDNIWPGV